MNKKAVKRLDKVLSFMVYVLPVLAVLMTVAIWVILAIMVGEL